MNRLTELALRNKSVVLLFSVALFVSGLVVLGLAPPGAAAGHRAALRDRHRGPAGRRRRGRGAAGDRAHRAGHQERAAPGAAVVDLGQLAVAGHRPVRLRHRTSRRPARPSSRPSARRPCRIGVAPRVSARQHQRPAGHRRVRRARRRRRPGGGGRASRATELLPQVRAIPGVSSADLTGGTTTRLRHHPRPGRRWPTAGVSLQQVQGILQANQLTMPAGSLVGRHRRAAGDRHATLHVARPSSGPGRGRPASRPRPASCPRR